MGHNQLLIGRVVRPHQVGVAGIVVDYELVNFLQAVLVTLGELLVFHAESPVRIACRKATISSDFVELVVIDDFENGGIEVEAIAARRIPPFAAGCRPDKQKWIEMGDGGHGDGVSGAWLVVSGRVFTCLCPKML